MQKRVTSWRGPSPRVHVIALAGNTAPFAEMLQQRRAVGNAVPDLTGPGLI